MSQEKKQDKKQKQLSKKGLEDLEKEIQECKKLKEEYLAGWQRAKADFLNYKSKELEKTTEILEYSFREFIIKILPILDNLENAKKHIPLDIKKNEWVKGVLQIQNQFKSFLEQCGVEKIQTLGKKFDPNFFESVGHMETEGKESGEVIEEIQKGYTLNGKVIRPAKVKIVK